jgi:4-amino-4-deoxy-L-arabinose transferase-like glycosyltransferase
LAALLVATALLRTAVVWAWREGLTQDPDAYLRYARTLLEHGTFLRNGAPSAWRPPLYPLLLAVCLTLPGPISVWIGVLHVTCGVATTWLVVSTGRLWNLGRAALVAGMLVALDPILLGESVRVMTETVATLAAAAAMLAGARLCSRPTALSAALSGIAIGLAALCRPAFLVWGLCLLPLAGWTFRRERPLRILAVYSLGLSAALSPWAVRNAVSLGMPIVTTSHGGYTLLLANNPYFYRFLQTRKPGEIWDSSQFVADWQSRRHALAGKNEINEDRLAYRLARSNICQAPLAFARACIYRLATFWRLAPYRVGQLGGWASIIVRLLITLWYFGLFACAILGLLEFERQRAPRTWLPALLLAISLSAVHTVYWTDMRMRAPAMPAVVLLAAAGGQRLAAWRLRRSSRRATT